MALQSSWVDALFARLALRYGAAFLRQWPDVDVAVLKTDWAEVLDGVSGHAIAYALEYLPSSHPPNAMQFRDLCRAAPAPKMARLTDDPAPNPERVAEAKAMLAKVKARITQGAT